MPDSEIERILGKNPAAVGLFHQGFTMGRNQQVEPIPYYIVRWRSHGIELDPDTDKETPAPFRCRFCAVRLPGETLTCAKKVKQHVTRPMHRNNRLASLKGTPAGMLALEDSNSTQSKCDGYRVGGTDSKGESKAKKYARPAYGSPFV